jgi:dihydrofolate reductase
LKNKYEKNFVIGGAQLLKDSLNLSSCRNLYLTRIGLDFESDVFMPE